MRVPLLALACALLGAWFALWLRSLRERSAGRARQARGKRGERDAEKLLLAHGYRIENRQATASYEIEVEGVARSVPLVMDFIVERNGQRLVAEVKTGTVASLGHRQTRRQLLEYQLASGASSVLLVDPEAETITRLSFPLQPASRGFAWRGLVLLALLLAVAVVWWRWLR